MSDINSEMKAAADYAIRSAKEKFGQELDFSDQSIDKLDNILVQVHRSISNLSMDDETRKVISRTANIWGSYLGEYMRMKWGGAWILKDSERVISIWNIEFSPIEFIYQKITSHPEYSLAKYLLDTENNIYPSLVIPQQSQNISGNISQYRKQSDIKLPKNRVTFDRRYLYIIIGIVGILVVLIAIIFGYSIIKKGGESAFGLLPSTPSHTVDALNMTVSTPKNTPTLTKTSGPTPTSWPTFTPFKSFTPRPTKTLTPNPISFDNSPKTIEGQVLISGDKSSNFPIITIYDVYAATKIGYSVSSNGKIFVVIRNRLENSGGMGEYSNIYWTALGSNGVFIDPYTASGIDCALGWDVTVIDGGTLDSCIVFEVPTHSKFTVMFVPFSYDRFNPERSLQWEITLP